MTGDTEAQAGKLARKIAALRIFRDEAGKMNLPLASVDGAVLTVSQFTLAADGMESGNRPGGRFATLAAGLAALVRNQQTLVGSPDACNG